MKIWQHSTNIWIKFEHFCNKALKFELKLNNFDENLATKHNIGIKLSNSNENLQLSMRIVIKLNKIVQLF